MSWEEERKLYADKLERIITSIEKIQGIGNNRIVTPEMRLSLRQLQSDAEQLLPKLKKGEFEIAVVGLEKAGKSSFSNALIGLTALPTADERCTFTSTCIRPVNAEQDTSRQEGYAEVTFYSQQEFDRSFREKLEVLGIPDAQLYTIENLSLEKYEQLFDECDSIKKQLYERSLHRDILDTLQFKQEIRRYIGSPKRTFYGDELKTTEFSSFITAPGRAIAVKDVVIYSTELQKMPNAVMYDVPGFNSPTAMHEEQTLQKMRAADAIIMVAKANEPTLTAEVLKIFQNPDVDGAYLSEKLFVFANKADLATDLQKNKQTTYHEWIERYKILPNSPEGKGRIVFGSANACLGDEGARSKLAALGEEDGIEKLRTKLITYYETTRFDVLKKRVNKIFVDLRKLFDTTVAANSAPVDNTLKYEIALTLQQELSGDISEQLNNLKSKLNTEALQERPLTAQLSERLKELVTLEKYQIKPDELERTHKEKAGVGMAEQPQAVDSALREHKFTQMYSDFVDEVLSCTGFRHSDVRQQILQIFLDAMHMSPESGGYDRLKDEIKELCALDNETDDGYYQSLIERFARDVFEVQIKFSQGMDRLNKFREEATNFFSLGVFYRASDNDDRLPYFQGADSPLWRLLLYPENANAAPKEQVIQKLQQLTGLKQVGDSISSLIDRIMVLEGDQTLVVLEKVFLDFLASGARPEAAVVFDVKELLNGILSGPEGSTADILEQILNGNRYQTDIADKHSNYSYEQVCQEFNDDILALQLVLQHAVVPAVSIDKAFSARETKLIEDIIEMLKGSDFIRFIARNAEIIKAAEFGRMKEEEAQRALDIAVTNEINVILTELMDAQAKR
mgnify:CR=1 FL=1